MQGDYELLISKLDAFIRKYYKDRLIRGALYAIGLVVAVFLVAALLEYLGRFGTTARTLLFWASIAAMAAILGRFIAQPLFKLLRLGRVISHAEAARIVGVHFEEVRDKLLNTLQLQDMAASQPGQRELIEAAVAQRSRELSPLQFVDAIDLRRNSRHLRLALPPVAILLLLLFAAPSLVSDSARRILLHGREFAPEAPFRFRLMNDSLVVPEEQDFHLVVEVAGDALPSQVDLVTGNARIPLVDEGGGRFSHRFRNVRTAVDFTLSAEGFSSERFTLTTRPDPLVLEMAVDLDFPGYLGLPPERQRSVSDLSVPTGTRIRWTIKARSADGMTMAFDDTLMSAKPVAEQSGFRFERRLLRSQNYQVTPRHEGHEGANPLRHRVEVVPDLHPSIAVQSRRDSSALKRVYFDGEIGDDHGIRRLLFHYRFVQGGDSVPADRRSGFEAIPFDPAGLRQRFYHAWDLYGLTILPGDRVEYWFEVWDNDGVNGSKVTRSATEVFAAPTAKELSERQEARSEATKDLLRENIREAQDLQRQLDELRRELLEKKEADWRDKQRLQQVMERQRQLEQRIERSTEQLRQSLQEQREFSPLDERLLEKQERIQELFENVLSEEMKELYRKVEELMQKVDKEQLQEQLREMKLGQEDVEKELDRALEMLKRMEVEQQAENLAKQLKELAEKQERLSEESRKGERDTEDLKHEQDALNEAFKELRKEMDELERKNEALEEPMDLPDTDQQEQDIQDEQQQSSEQLNRKQGQKAAGSQKQAAEKMEQLAFQMESAMQAGAQEQQEEDMDALRQLLENIVELSFDQETLMAELGETSVRDPRWVQHGRDQRKLRDDAKVIEDSLFALSKRVPQLQSMVNREMHAVNDNMDEATRLMGEARANERFKPMAADKQQHAMTSLNNLALLLDEALQQMMQQMNAQSKPGSGNCKKPGSNPSPGQGNKSGMAKMRAQQEALQKQLEQMRKSLEEGRKKGEKPGQQNPGGTGLPGMSQQLAQLAAQQAAIRKEMQRISQELNKDGSGAGNELNRLAQQMEQQERDIVNKSITPETIRRQQDILTRLLEHEKAERERELDQKRTSNEGREQPPADPARAFEMQRRKAREAELLRTVPPGLKPYYKERVNGYFGTFDRP